MKLIATTIIALAMAASAQAQYLYPRIETAEHEIFLEDKPCQRDPEGKQATAIGKGNNMPALACWYRRDKQVVLRWYAYRGANGGWLDANDFQAFSASRVK